MDGFNLTWTSDNVSTSSLKPYPNYHTSNTSSAAAPLPFNVVTAVIYTIVFVVGLLGNTLAIYVVVRYAKMKTVTNMYILNLALADELYILGIPFLGTQSVLSYWPYGEFFCKVYMTADAMSQFASTYCLTVMSIDRYLAVAHPIRSAKWRKPQLAKISNALVWVVSFLIVLPVTIYSDVQENFNSCNITWPEPQYMWSIVFILYTAILSFFGPLLVICVCYLLIVIRVRSAGMRAGLTKRRKSERKVTRMVVIIVLVFVICWLPFFTTNIVNLIHPIPENNTTIYSFLVILTYVNSCANPVLYGFLSENFKRSFQKVLCIHKPNGVAAADKMGGRQKAPKENHNQIQNGQIQSIESVQVETIRDLNSEPLNSKPEVNGHPLP